MIVIILAVAIITWIAYLLIQKPIMGTTIVVGLLSLLAIGIGTAPIISLEYLTKLPFSITTLFAYVLIACSLAFLIAVLLSLNSIFKLIGVNKEKAHKLLKKTFKLTIAVSSVALLIALLSIVLQVPELKKSCAYYLFTISSYYSGSEFSIFGLVILDLLLLVMWSYVGLLLLKKEQNIISAEQQKTLSNRASLSIISFLISIVSLLLILLMVYGKGALNLGLHIIGILTILVLCSLSLLMLLSGVSTVLTSILKPEKIKKYLKFLFGTTTITSVIILLCSIIDFSIVAFFKMSIASSVGSNEKVFIIPLLIIMSLGIAGYLLIGNSNIKYNGTKQ